MERQRAMRGENAMAQVKRIWALGGESHAAPEDTMVAYWGALGAGADGIVVGVQLTRDGKIVCVSHPTLGPTCGDHRAISTIDSNELQELDAGSQFQSTVLDANNQPTGRGKDFPWKGHTEKKDSLYHPELDEVLIHLGRRTPFLLQLFTSTGKEGNHQESKLMAGLAGTLRRFGLISAAIVAGGADLLRLFRQHSSETPLALVVDSKSTPVQAAAQAKKLVAAYVIVRAEQLVRARGKQLSFAPGATKAFGTTLKALVTSEKMPYAFSNEYFQLVWGAPWVAGVFCRAVRETVAMRSPLALTVQDEFSGTSINRDYWVAGYSRPNQDTQIFVDNGLVIQITEGGEYSGAAALTHFPITGDFEARVAFSVASPAQGTTFEMAAIQVDPGYHHMDNRELDRKSVNLTFDVHGAPPYASSERDEDDGFRIGWNNGPALTEFIDHSAQSSNLYNKYSRDVGDGSRTYPEGQLRLVRTKDVFNAYYTDRQNSYWLLSGTACVPTLCREVFLRLGAKHWPKGGRVPPPNMVRFSKFRLYQPVSLPEGD